MTPPVPGRWLAAESCAAVGEGSCAGTAAAQHTSFDV